MILLLAKDWQNNFLPKFPRSLILIIINSIIKNLTLSGLSKVKPLGLAAVPFLGGSLSKSVLNPNNSIVKNSSVHASDASVSAVEVVEEDYAGANDLSMDVFLGQFYRNYLPVLLEGVSQ